MKEIWKDIPGYEGLYQVSNMGRVKSLNFNRSGLPRILKTKNRQGYPRVILWKSGKRHEVCVHRLVAQAFIPNPENKPFVNHKDGNRRNNHVDNLEWCTAQENAIHSVTVLGNNPNKWSSTPVMCAETGEVWPTQVAAAESLGASQGDVGRAARLNCHTVKGKHIFFVTDKESPEVQNQC